MYIKTWDSCDMGVYKVNKGALERLLKTLSKFSQEEIEQIKLMAKDFGEALGVEFAHNLRRGWQKAILNEGQVFDKNKKELLTVDQIKEAFMRDGEIEFHAYKKNTSLKVIDFLRKPAHLCWS